MNVIDISLENKLIISSDTIIKGKTDLLDITFQENSNCKVLFISDEIKEIKINVLQDSNISIDYLHFNAVNINRTINVYKNANLKEKVISAYVINSNLQVNLQEEYASITSNYLIVSKDFKSNIIQTINHNSKYTNSNIENYGISLENSQVSFDTTGIIKKGNSKSVCKQLSRGIICGNNSAVKSLPILLIDEYDVSANHGAAIGKMSDDELFYLMSRGLNKTEAFKLILSGVINPFVDNLIEESYKEKVKDSIYNLI